ncbi:MAG: tetratricopeptide repeat protein [Chitinispirillaceae bacterium]|nr:tetratricopeptide repeat protein [Chitinispirillaceae bacterium]
MKHLLLLLLALIVISCDDSGNLLKKGSVHLALGDYIRARECFASEVDRHPSSAAARIGLGKALLQEYASGSRDSTLLVRSITQLEAARTLRPDTVVEKLLSLVWLKRAEGLLAAADTVTALQALSRSTSLDHASAPPVNLAGILYFHRGERDKALNLFRKVITLDTASVSGRFNAGLVLWTDRNFTVAYDYFFAAAKRSPDNPEILLWAARAKKEAAGGTP